MNIEDYLSSTKYTTRKELVEKTNLSDREIRRKISELKKHRVVIYSSSKKRIQTSKRNKKYVKYRVTRRIKVSTTQLK